MHETIGCEQPSLDRRSHHSTHRRLISPKSDRARRPRRGLSGYSEAIAHTKPASSRAQAITISWCGWPAASLAETYVRAGQKRFCSPNPKRSYRDPESVRLLVVLGGS